jgi:hypothetical protein
MPQLKQYEWIIDVSEDTRTMTTILTGEAVLFKMRADMPGGVVFLSVRDGIVTSMSLPIVETQSARVTLELFGNRHIREQDVPWLYKEFRELKVGGQIESTDLMTALIKHEKESGFLPQ